MSDAKTNSETRLNRKLRRLAADLLRGTRDRCIDRFISSLTVREVRSLLQEKK